MSASKLAEPRKLNSGFMEFLFSVNLLTVLFHDSWLWVARISWILLAMLFILESRFCIQAVFFLGSFFYSAGFLESLPMTVKHFHIAAVLMAITAFIKEDPRSYFPAWKISAAGYLPLFVMLFISALNSTFLHSTRNSLHITLNFTLVLLLISFFQAYLSRSKEWLIGTAISRGILYAASGAALQILAAGSNTFWGTRFFNDLTLVHNNHLGILSALSVFYTLPVLSSAASEKEKGFSFTCLAILFFGLVASCSRTAWFSFLAGLITYFFLRHRLIEKEHLRSRQKRVLFALFALTISILAFTNDDIMRRILNLPQLFDLSYWHYILNDKQNFGCFGIYRLRDIKELVLILKSYPISGVGFTPQVVDMHGLYFIILGSSGIAGLILFVIFLSKSLSDQWRSLCQKEQSIEVRYIQIGCFSSMIVWVFCSTMESYFLHFIVWLNFAISFLLTLPKTAPRNKMERISNEVS